MCFIYHLICVSFHSNSIKSKSRYTATYLKHSTLLICIINLNFIKNLIDFDQNLGAAPREQRSIGMFDVAVVFVTDAIASFVSTAHDASQRPLCHSFGLVQSVPCAPQRQVDLVRRASSSHPQLRIPGHVHFFRSGTILLSGFSSQLPQTSR